MLAAGLLRWIVIIILGAATVYVYHPTQRPSSGLNLQVARGAALDFRGHETFALAESIVNHHRVTQGRSLHCP
jgi:hypothetical protein